MWVPKNWCHDLSSRWNSLRLIWIRFSLSIPLFWLLLHLRKKLMDPWLILARRKVIPNSYHRNRNGYCTDRNCWAEILCCSYSAFTTVLARTFPSSFEYNTWAHCADFFRYYLRITFTKNFGGKAVINIFFRFFSEAPLSKERKPHTLSRCTRTNQLYPSWFSMLCLVDCTKSNI